MVPRAWPGLLPSSSTVTAARSLAGRAASPRGCDVLDAPVPSQQVPSVPRGRDHPSPGAHPCRLGSRRSRGAGGLPVSTGHPEEQGPFPCADSSPLFVYGVAQRRPRVSEQEQPVCLAAAVPRSCDLDGLACESCFFLTAFRSKWCGRVFFGGGRIEALCLLDTFVLWVAVGSGAETSQADCLGATSPSSPNRADGPDKRAFAPAESRPLQRGGRRCCAAAPAPGSTWAASGFDLGGLWVLLAWGVPREPRGAAALMLGASIPRSSGAGDGL